MPTEKKGQNIQAIEEKLKQSKAVYFANYRGLSVNKMQELKNKLKESEAELQVTKNTLLTIALEKKGKKLENELEGPTATLFTYNDEIEPLKSLIDFAKENDNLPELKFGLLEEDFLDVKKLEYLATLPSKEILLTQLAGTLQAPIKNFMYGLNYHTTSLITVLNNIKDQKSN